MEISKQELCKLVGKLKQKGNDWDHTDYTTLIYLLNECKNDPKLAKKIYNSLKFNAGAIYNVDTRYIAMLERSFLNATYDPVPNNSDLECDQPKKNKRVYIYIKSDTSSCYEIYDIYCKDPIGLKTYKNQIVEHYGLKNLSYLYEFNSSNGYTLLVNHNDISQDEQLNVEKKWNRMVKNPNLFYKNIDQYISNIDTDCPKYKDQKQFKFESFYTITQWIKSTEEEGVYVSIPTTLILDEIFVANMIEQGAIDYAFYNLPYSDSVKKENDFFRICNEIENFFEVTYLGDFEKSELLEYERDEDITLNQCCKIPAIKFVKAFAHLNNVPIKQSKRIKKAI